MTEGKLHAPSREERLRWARERIRRGLMDLEELEAESTHSRASWPSGVDLIRAAIGLDSVVVESRELAERCRNGSHDGDEAASERHRFADACASVAAWLRKLVEDAGPGV